MGEEKMLAAGALDLAAAIRQRELTPVELVAAHMRRIERVNPQLNALVADRFDAARLEAERALAEVRDAVSPASLAVTRPLLGVPFTTKEMIAVDGMPLTFGSRARSERRATRDATVVARLRAAGAIPLGVSNMPEWGMWTETYNDLYGRTSNPYDHGRTAGGSSGGEGALVGAGASAFGIGSDIGGSIRMPAAFCGTYAHKPSSGLLPLTGHYPVQIDGPDAGVPRTSPYLVIGPLTRSARDLMPLLRIMAGPDGHDPNVEAMRPGDPQAVDWRGRRVLLLPSPRITRARAASAALQHEVHAAGRTLEEQGAVVEEVPAELLKDAGDVWFGALQAVGGPGFAAILGGGQPVRLLPELAAALLRRRRYSWPALFFCIAERVASRGARGLQRALEARRRLGLRFDALLGDGGVLILPTHPRVAPRHNEPALFPFDFLYTAAFNALRVPVTAVPVGFDERGLPLSVQIAARHGCDHLTIAAALAIEAVRPAWQPAGLGLGSA